MSDKLHDAAKAIFEKADGMAAAQATFIVALLKDRALLTMLAGDYLRRFEPRSKLKPTGRRRLGPHRSPKGPSRSQKAATRAATQDRLEAIFDRRLRGGKLLGDVRMNELRARAEEAANTATSFLTRGYDDAVEAIAMAMLAQHVVASDPFAKLRDVIKPSVATNIFEQAKVRAAEEIRDASARMASHLVRIAATPGEVTT